MATNEKLELEEKEFIQERYSHQTFPLWASVATFLFVALALYLFSAWMDHRIEEDQREMELEETNPAS